MKPNGVLVASLVLIRLYCAFYMIISDCDEVFNYWEPLNFLLRNFGKQTWEYSPEYSIRSWLFLLPLYVLDAPINLVLNLFSLPQYFQFYYMRTLLCLFSVYCEAKLYTTVHTRISAKIANWFLLFSMVAPGMSHASVSFLPSSFAMNCNILAVSHIINSMTVGSCPDQYHSICALLWFFVGGVYGWPFALALSIPFGVYLVVSSLVQKKPDQLFRIFKWCFVWCLVLVGLLIQIDSFFYKKTDLIPLNIVLYNVFGGEGEGPEIFGVEPFSYYVLNLLLNFNVVFIFGYLGLIINVVFGGVQKRTLFLVILAPIALWSFIFGSQPHKEERFMYPIYPLINLSGAIFISLFMTFVNKAMNFILRGKLRIITKILNFVVIFICGVSITTVSLLRIINLVENYSSPLQVFTHLSSEKSNISENVCVGREWYHYPSSFFLENNQRFRFVKSGFNGLLPGDFHEGVGWSAVSEVPNMNNKNIFDETKLSLFEECDYYIDISEPIDVEAGEYELMTRNDHGLAIDDSWKSVYCDKFIKPDQSKGIGKILYIPLSLRKWVQYEVEYTDYCLLKRQ